MCGFGRIDGDRGIAAYIVISVAIHNGFAPARAVIVGILEGIVRLFKVTDMRSLLGVYSD